MVLICKQCGAALLDDRFEFCNIDCRHEYRLFNHPSLAMFKNNKTMMEKTGFYKERLLRLKERLEHSNNN